MTATGSFGQWLKQQRRALDLTQDALARKVGCAVVTIQKIEANERRPSRRLAEHLAQYFDIPESAHAEFVQFARGAVSSTASTSLHSPLNLSTPSTPFVGRNDELKLLHTRLSSHVRLLTLVGPGGIGKTRLALEAARRFPNAQFVSLQPLTAPNFIVSSIATVIGFQFYSSGEPKEQLLNYLRSKSWLLVLDNFEHLLDGATLLSEILAAAPDVRLLVTSRERLNLAEEWVFDVEGLVYPEDENGGELERYSAVELFVQHAQRAKVSFALTDNNRAAVVRICRLVDGMPLGIELAASWVRVLSCEAIAEEIERSLDILETTARNVEPRHRTMRAAFEPTWERLSEDERDVFMRLSVFRGGFTRETAREVAGASLRTLSALVDKSLVRVDATGRYDLQELLRQYAVEKLVEADEVNKCARCHSSYFLKLGVQADAHIYSQDQPVWLDHLETELDNLRAVLTRSLEDGEIETGLRLVTVLRWFWEYRSHIQEGLTWSERLLAVALDVPPSLRAKGLCCIVELGGQDAINLAKEALALSRQLNDSHDIAWALSTLGFYTGYEQLKDRAALLEESIALFRKINNPHGLSHALRRRAGISIDQEDYFYAQTLLNEALMRARESGDKSAAARALLFLAFVFFAQTGGLPQAAAFFEESIVLFQAWGNWYGAISPLIYLARIEQILGHYERAQGLYEEAWAAVQETNNYVIPVFGDTLAGFGILMEIQGKPAQAAQLLGALAREHPVDNPAFPSEAINRCIASVRVQLGKVAFERAWADGQAMTRQQVTMYALQCGRLSAKAAEISATLEQSLSSRELDVLRLVAEGYSNQEIAVRLYIGVSTVKKHINHLYDKLDAKNRTQAVARARECKMLTS